MLKCYNKTRLKRLLSWKKFIIFIIFVLLILTAGFLRLKYGNNKIESVFTDEDNTTKEDLFSKDTDADGLKDWEEILWKTDINNLDTDTDGTSDGDEVSSNRNPLVIGPDDKLEIQDSGRWNSIESTGINSSSRVNLTLELAQNMGTDVTSGSKDINNIDFSDSSSFLNQDMSENMALFIASLDPKVSEKEIKVSASNDEATVRKYLIDISNIIFSPDYPKGDEAVIIDKAIQTGNFTTIDKYINFYGKSISSMKSMIVPPDFVATHKRGLELMMINKIIYESIKDVKTDALRAIIALERYAKVRTETAELLLNFANLAEKYTEKYGE